MKALLSISDCQLMHERINGNLPYTKSGNRFLYELDQQVIESRYQVANHLFDWFKLKHKVELDNFPIQKESVVAALKYIREILVPIRQALGTPQITYGFVSASLNTYIQKYSSSGTCPALDQHSSHELNSKNNFICSRGGLACDFYVVGYENKMNLVAHYIVDKLKFDKLYYYGKSRPIHLSVNDDPKYHFQIMSVSQNGRRIPGRKAYGSEAKNLSKELLK